MPLTATLCLDHADNALINLHDAPSDSQPFVFVTVDGCVSLWADAPESLRRLSLSLQSAADKLQAAIEERAAAAQVGA